MPIAQAQLVDAHDLLEPKEPDSLVSWGFFNTAFERKEYMEAYVAEEVARGDAEEDPAVRAGVREAAERGCGVRAQSGARLEFFYRRHPSWDERCNLYPVYRVDAAP